ncbi:hypothetical protein [Acidipropionibacterium thoenii]|uniref:hypothetical protein n=1 Tax=Acidipropionibacterium thoenii TaxID=1751 RepID=UPI00048071CE
MGNLLLFTVFLVGMIATMAAMSRARHQARELEQQRARAIESRVSQMRRDTEADVTAFGESLRDLDLEVGTEDLTADARTDWTRALDCYDRAKDLMLSDRGTGNISLVTEALEEGRHAIACVRAREKGEPVPEQRPPCFFDPSHGPSTTEVMWAPDGGVARKVPACQADAQRIKQGHSPWIRTVATDNGTRVPYWQAGQDYAPWLNGYYQRYTHNPVASGMAIGGIGLLGFGLFSALFDEGQMGDGPR